jgi:hypothetical protein
VVNSQHDERLPGLPSLRGNKEKHECQKVQKGAMNETTRVGKKTTGYQYQKCKWRCEYCRAGKRVS